MKKSLYMKVIFGVSSVALQGCIIKPDPLTTLDVAKQTQTIKKKMIRARPRIESNKLSLNHAVARSVKYNIETRIKTFETILAARHGRLKAEARSPR